jgi:hypothetical protein
MITEWGESASLFEAEIAGHFQILTVRNSLVAFWGSFSSSPFSSHSYASYYSSSNFFSALSLDNLNMNVNLNLKQPHPKRKSQSLLFEINSCLITEEALRTEKWCWCWYICYRVWKLLSLQFDHFSSFTNVATVIISAYSHGCVCFLYVYVCVWGRGCERVYALEFVMDQYIELHYFTCC